MLYQKGEKMLDKAISTVTMGPKGQVVITKEIREMFHINPGDRIVVLADIKRGIAIIKESDFLSLRLKDEE